MGVVTVSCLKGSRPELLDAGLSRPGPKPDSAERQLCPRSILLRRNDALSDNAFNSFRHSSREPNKDLSLAHIDLYGLEPHRAVALVTPGFDVELVAVPRAHDIASRRES